MIPFSAWQGLFLIIAIFFVVFSSWKTLNISKIVLLVSIIVLSGLHFVPANYISGWSVCLRREVLKESLRTPCEPSSEYKDGSSTFRIPTINWAANFIPLYFMNDKQAFNFYKETEPDRNHLPYSFFADANVRGGNSHELQITTTLKDVAVTVDGNTSHVTSNNSLSLPENRPYAVHVAYSQIRNVRDALTIDAPIISSPIQVAYSIFYIVVLGVACTALLVEIGRRLRNLNAKYRKTVLLLLFASLFLFIQDEITQWTLFLGFLGIWYTYSPGKNTKAIILPGFIFLGFHVARSMFTSQPFEDVFLPYGAGFLAYIALVSFFGIAILKKYGKRVLPFILSLLLLSSFAYTQHLNPYGKLVLFSGGDDELTHEGFAREALLSQHIKSYLTAGENSVFYYQPLYRYILAGIHNFWGESMFGVFTLQTFLLALGFAVLLYAIAAFEISGAALLFSVLFSIINIIPNQSLLTITQRGFQQGIGTPLLFISLALVLVVILRRPTIFLTIISGLILGLTISVRSDYLPAIIVLILGFIVSLFTVTTWKKRIQIIVLFAVCFSIFPSLVITRNMIIAGSPAFMPTSGLYNLADPYSSVFLGENLKQIGSGQALLYIISSYSGHYSDLLSSLTDHLIKDFIGSLPIRLILWYGALPVFLASLFIISSWQKKVAGIVLILVFFALILPSLFFVQHNGVAMLGHYSVLLAVLLALGFGTLYSKFILAK